MEQKISEMLIPHGTSTRTGVRVSGRGRKMRKRNNGFLLAFPALAGFLVFYFVPFLITVWYSVSFGIWET